MTTGRTRAVINRHQVMTGEFTRKPDLAFPADEMERLIAEAAGPGRADFLEATRLATALTGDSIATNLFMMGHAWQKGPVPLRPAGRQGDVWGRGGELGVSVGGSR